MSHGAWLYSSCWKLNETFYFIYSLKTFISFSDYVCSCFGHRNPHIGHCWVCSWLLCWAANSLSYTEGQRESSAWRVFQWQTDCWWHKIIKVPVQGEPINPQIFRIDSPCPCPCQQFTNSYLMPCTRCMSHAYVLSMHCIFNYQVRVTFHL